MGEISVTDVANYTGGRLDPGDAEVARMLAAALVVARRGCGWHVSPVKVNHAMTIDGPDSRILFLPTMKLATPLSLSVTEDGTLLDPDTISISAGDGPEMPRRVALRKRSARWWTAEYGGIELVMSHGFTEAEAKDWRDAIMSMVDQMSLIPIKSATGTSDFGMSSKRVDDVAYGWRDPYIAMAEEVVLGYGHILCGYELARVELI